MLPARQGRAKPVEHVLVRGAGVSGLSTAVALAEEGFRVTLTEAGSAVGSGASWKAGGMLSPWIEAETAPPALLERSIPSISWWAARVPGVEKTGSLVLAMSRDGSELTRFARRTTGHEALAADGLAALEPDLAGRFGRALFYGGEAHLDPRAALRALSERLRALGGTLLLGEPGMPAGRFDRIVDCRGFAARPGLPGLRGVRGEMLLLRCPGVALSRPVRLLHPRFPVYVVPRPEHVFMVGATVLESEDRGPPRLRSMTELMSAAFALHPAFGEAEILEIAADLRPSLGDNMPRVTDLDGVLHVNGMFRHGFLMAPVLAQDVVRALRHGSTAA